MTLLKPIIFKFIGFNITCLLAYTPSFQVSTFNFTSLYLFFEFGLLTTVVYLVIDRMTVNSFYKTKSFVLMYVYAILLIQLSFYCFHLLGFELDNTIFAAVASTGSNLV